jgi:hypothetical protein
MLRKIPFIVFSLFIFLFVSCEKQTPETFQIVVGDKVWITENDIEFYDFSSQLIYLKKDDLFTSNPVEFFRVFKGPFEVQLDEQIIYEGNFHASYSSTRPFGAYISIPQFYSRDIIHLDYIDTNTTNQFDPRNDEHIISTMKKLGLYRGGISCAIDEITINNNNPNFNTSEIQFTFTIENRDQTALYILDPDLIGNPLFHYYTNGLLLLNKDRKRYYSYTGEHTSPESWDDWEPEWLYVLKKGKRISRTLSLQNYEYIPPGKYICTFDFPGLIYQISREERMQTGGRIWMGSIRAQTYIEFTE